MKKTTLAFSAALLTALLLTDVSKAEVLAPSAGIPEYTVPITVNDELTITKVTFNNDDEFNLIVTDKSGKTYDGTATISYMKDLVCNSPADRRQAYGATEADWDCSSDKAALISIFKEWAKQLVDALGQDGDVQFDENGEPIF